MSANPTACLLVIGNEVLSGRTQDLNIKFLATGLGAIGMPLREVRVIPDVPDTIIATVAPSPTAATATPAATAATTTTATAVE